MNNYVPLTASKGAKVSTITRNRPKGIKITELVRQARKLSNAPRGQRTFQYPDRAGYFTVGKINGNKINFTFHAKNPATSDSHVKGRFQIYDNVDKTKIYATNTDDIVKAVWFLFGQKVYFYNEVAKKAAKQKTTTKRVGTTVKSKSRPSILERLKAFFHLSA